MVASQYCFDNSFFSNLGFLQGSVHPGSHSCDFHAGNTQPPLEVLPQRNEFGSLWSLPNPNGCVTALLPCLPSSPICLVAQTVKNLPTRQETLPSLSREDTRKREWQPTPVFLPGESHGQRSWVGYSLWGRKESDMTEIFTHPFACLKPFNSFCLFL